MHEAGERWLWVVILSGWPRLVGWLTIGTVFITPGAMCLLACCNAQAAIRVYWRSATRADSAIVSLACEWQRQGHLREFSVLGTTASVLDNFTAEVARSRVLLPWQLITPGSIGLVLNDMHLGTRSVEFFEALQHDHVLSKLHLTRVPLGSDYSADVKRLAKAIEANSSLQQLCLNDSRIGDRGLDTLAAALGSKISL
eukprot:1317096-Amphidinium_carterae.1